MTASSTLLKLVEPSSSTSDLMPSSRLVDIVDVDQQGRISVAVDGIAVQAACLEHVVRGPVGLPVSLIGRQALVIFSGTQRQRPVIVGLVSVSWGSPPAAPSPSTSKAFTARVDGNNVLVEADDELTLRCGKASVTLTADGKILIKGMEIVSRALLAHKIKGGTVNIN